MIDELLVDIGDRVVDKMKDKLASYDLGGSDIINNITSEVKETSPGVFELVFNMPDYAVYIDKGRKPGSRMPPQKPIEEWLKKKGIPLRASFAIRKTISARGVKPRPFLDIIDKELENISNEILNSETKYLSITLDEILQKIN